MRAATIRGLSRSPTAGVFSEVNEAFTPRSLPNLAAWFDALDTSSMLSATGTTITDGGAVALWGDKSGNSGVNCLCAPGANTTANSATLGAIGALGTGDFTVVARVSISSFSSGTDLLLVGIGNGANSANLIAKNGTSRIQMSKAAVGYVSATNGSNLSAFTTYTITYTKSGTTGTYYINGIADGTCTDSFDYTANSGVSIGQFNTGVGGIVYHARVYSVSLDSAGVLADYNGTVQANCTVNCDFTLAAKKLANGDTFVCTTGQTVTLNSSGATGARIAGERDLYQGTLANRPVYLAYAGTKYGYSNGATGAYFSTGDSAAVSYTTSFDLVCRYKPTSWTSSNVDPIITKWSASNLSYFFGFVSTSKTPVLYLSSDGSATSNVAASANFPFSDGDTGWVRVTWRKSDGRVQFWYAADSATVPASNGWTQLGVDRTLFSGTSVFDGNAALCVGYDLNAPRAEAGNFYYAETRGTIDGSPDAIFNPALYSSGTTLKDGANPLVDWTVQGGAHIVTRTGLYFNGSTHSLKTAAFSLSQPETRYLIGSQVSWTDNDYISDGSSGTAAILQQTSTPRIKTYAGGSGSLVVENDGFVLKTPACVAAVLNGASSATQVNRGAATTGTISTGTPNGSTIGSTKDGTTPANIFVCEMPIYSVAHDKPTRDRMALYAGRRHGFAA